jgi:hypothetical protein
MCNYEDNSNDDKRFAMKFPCYYAVQVTHTISQFNCFLYTFRQNDSHVPLWKGFFGWLCSQCCITHSSSLSI